ncbi:MAG: DUF1080 domain-containing protein [Limnochordales bacterium]|nr:DUF1080 domain-containing protein [Limnochordales bacterium]
MSLRKGLLIAGIFAALVLAAGTVSLAASGEVLFQDDFSAGLDNWYLDTGTGGTPDKFYADPNTKAMVFDPVGFGNAFAGDENWTDYAFEAEVTIHEYPQYGNFRFFVRMNELWYGYGVNFVANGLTIFRFDGNWDVRTVLGEAWDAKAGIPLDTPTHVRVEVKGNQITVFVNGEQVAQVEDPEAVYPNGRVGFRFDYVRGEVRNVKVTAL